MDAFHIGLLGFAQGYSSGWSRTLGVEDNLANVPSWAVHCVCSGILWWTRNLICAPHPVVWAAGCSPSSPLVLRLEGIVIPRSALAGGQSTGPVHPPTPLLPRLWTVPGAPTDLPLHRTKWSWNSLPGPRMSPRVRVVMRIRQWRGAERNSWAKIPVLLTS